jgi:hypothetical protein
MESAFYWPVPAAGTIRGDWRRRHFVSEAAMDYRQAISVLTKMLEERSLAGEEKEAVLTAIGVRDWASLGKNKMTSMAEKRKAKRDKDVQW